MKMAERLGERRKSVKMEQLGERDENGIQSLGVRDENYFCISITSGCLF
jgi:hypothetical protein